MNNTYIAIGIAVSLLGAVIGVQYFYGWGNVAEDVSAMGKSVWFQFAKWVGVKTGNETTLMPEEYAEEQEIVETGTKVKEEVERLPLIGRVIETSERVLNRLTNDTLKNIEYVSNVNTSRLQEELTKAIGTSVQFVNVTLSTGMKVLMPIENATRRALGEDLPRFFKSVSQSLEEFFTSNEMRTLIQSVIEIPQSVIMSIQEVLVSLTGTMFSGMSTGVSDTFELDAITGAW
jgi:hypothetical protein